MSEDRQFGLTVIAFVGSVFSPYYAWARRRDPLDHCAVNVALYGPRGTLWAMTERRRAAVSLTSDTLEIGRSRAVWSGDGLAVEIDERAAPLPRRLRGRIQVRAGALNPRRFVLEEAGQHWWQPILPSADVEVEMDSPALRWRGRGYFDQNAGAEPLEHGFRRWTWSRTATIRETTVFYDAERRRGPPLSLALRFDTQGGFETRTPLHVARLPRTRWGLDRATRADDGRASALRSFEDTPFYARGLIEHTLYGKRVEFGPREPVSRPLQKPRRTANAAISHAAVVTGRAAVWLGDRISQFRNQPFPGLARDRPGALVTASLRRRPVGRLAARPGAYEANPSLRIKLSKGLRRIFRAQSTGRWAGTADRARNAPTVLRHEKCGASQHRPIRRGGVISCFPIWPNKNRDRTY